MPHRFDVFLSHASATSPWSRNWPVRLARENLKPWLDKWNLDPRRPPGSRPSSGLDDCATCAVIIGAGGFGAWQNEEMRAAIDRRVEECQGQFRVIPVLLPGVDRPERGKLPAFLLATTWVEFRHSLDDAEAFHRLVCGIQGKEPGAGLGGARLRGSVPVPRAGGLRRRARPVLLRPRGALGVASQRAAAQGHRAREPLSGDPGGLGQRQVVAGPSRAGRRP